MNDLMLVRNKEAAMIRRDDSQSPLLCLTPDLEQSSTSHTDESTMGTPVPTLPTSESSKGSNVALPGLPMHQSWESLMHEVHLPYYDLTLGFTDTKEALLSLPPSGRIRMPNPIEVPSPASWLTSDSQSPSDTSSSCLDHTLPLKRSSDVSNGILIHEPTMAFKRARTSPTGMDVPPSYQVPSLIPMDPHPMPADRQSSDHLRAWLLERRALLQKAHDDVTKDMAALHQDMARRNELRMRLNARISLLRQRRMASLTSLAMLKPDGEGNELWDSAHVSSVADLLEQNILYL